MFSLMERKPVLYLHSLPLLQNVVARLVSRRWNQLYPALLLIYEKLDKLGLQYVDGVVVYEDEEGSDV